ncbi:MAG TPA: substrate-binding domain-containing protein [Streptosporangiaceae bacterium]|nr:substrate-binding domain-containing protein [Streptosporangiaceae bacterium]
MPASLDPATVTPPTSQVAVNNTANRMGAPQPLVATLWSDIHVTPAQVKEICSKHLSAVFLDWSNVTYNKAIDSGMQQEYKALGVNLIRITDSEFSPTGTAGDLAAVLPLKPDIILTGGTINPSQMASIMAPAVAQHKIIVSWGVGGPGMPIGPDKPMKALIAYDWYYLGEQMAQAVHQAFPHGANLGYIHWINDIDPILLRESGFLDGLKKYPNIHVIAAGGPANPARPNSGFTDPSGAEAYTEAFLQSHKNVNVIFAPWENPPGLGEVAAIKALHLQNKVSVVTMDLAEAGAASLRQNGVIKVDMAQDVYDGGRMMALASALAAIHAKYPTFINFPTFAATSANVKDAWNFMHGPQLPCTASVCG